MAEEIKMNENSDNSKNYLNIIEEYNNFINQQNFDNAINLINKYVKKVSIISKEDENEQTPMNEQTQNKISTGGAAIRTYGTLRKARQEKLGSEYFEPASTEDIEEQRKKRLRQQQIQEPIEIEEPMKIEEQPLIELETEEETKSRLQSELVRLTKNYENNNYLYFLYYVYYNKDLLNQQFQEQLNSIKEIIETHNIQQIKAYLDLYEEIILNNNLDLFEALSTETNRDYLIDAQHYMNVYNIYNDIFNAVIEQNEGAEETKMELSQVKTEEAEELKTNTQIRQKKMGSQEDRPILKKTKTELNLSQSEEDIQTAKRSRISPSSWLIGGASEGAFCEGKMGQSLTLIDPLNINLYSYLVAGLSKTRDELTHDFKGDHKLTNLLDLVKSYDAVINSFVSDLEKNINNSSDNTEAKKMLHFIKLLQEKKKGDPEWNYYTSSLQIMDSECSKLNDLNIIKIAKLSKYPLLNTEIAQPYIIELQKDVSSVSSTSSASSSDSSGISTTSDLQGKYLYIPLTSMNLPVKPIYTLGQLKIRFEDNPVDLTKLIPLVNDYNTDIPKIYDAITLEEFKKSFFTLKYGPGLIDPKTTNPVPLSVFNDSDVSNDIRTIQQQQNINDNNIAKKIMIDGANLFMGYFGVRENLVNNVEFIIDNDKIKGISFEVLKNYPLELHIGDTTIANIANFVNRSSDGLIKVNGFKPENDSDNRLYKFGKYIYDNINSEIKKMLVKSINSTLNVNDVIAAQYLLTQIIICLKSFGDSYQVYYSKQFASQSDNNNLYISSTDKNVAGESFLLNNKFLIIGTGIRPHEAFAKNEEYSKFFYKKQLYDYFNVDESKYKVVDDEIDTIITITTNITLNAEDYIKMIIDTYKNIKNIITELSELSEPSNAVLIVEQIFNNFNSSSVFSSNDSRINYQSVLIEKLNTNSENIETLKEINNYLKTIYDILRLTEGIDETGETLLETKLKFITDITSTDFINKLNKITKKEIQRVNKLDSIKNIIENINIKQNYPHLFDAKFRDFAQNYLKPTYNERLREINNRYKSHLENISTEIKNKIELFEPTKTTEPVRSVRTAAKKANESIKEQIVETGTISQKIEDLQGKALEIQNKINELKSEIETYKEGLSIDNSNLEKNLKTQLSPLKRKKNKKKAEMEKLEELEAKIKNINDLKTAEIEFNKIKLIIETNEEKIKKKKEADPRKDLYELLLQNQAYFITDLIPKLEIRTIISTRELAAIDEEATSSTTLTSTGGKNKTKKYKYNKHKLTKNKRNKKYKKTKYNKLQKRRQIKTKKNLFKNNL